MKTIKFQIDSCDPKEELRLEDFLTELYAIKKALDALNENMFNGKESYRIVRIKKESPATVELLSANDILIKEFYYGLASPNYIEPNVAKAFSEIGKTVSRNKIKFLGNGNGLPEIEIKEPIDKVISKTNDIEVITQISFVSGKLEAMNLHGDQKTITIYPEFGITRVRCIVPKELIVIVEKSVNKKVTVFGTTKTKYGEKFPYEILASDIKINKTKDEIPHPDELWGIAGNKDNIPTEEFLKNLRND